MDSPSHPVAIYQTLTGGDLPDASVEAKNRNLAHPSIGSIIARACGLRAPLLPPYVAIPHSGQLGNPSVTRQSINAVKRLQTGGHSI